MEKSSNNLQTLLLAIVLIAFAAITRFIPHPFNFTAVGAMALFAGANIKDKRSAFLLPIVVLFLTDLFLGFHFSMVPVYLSFSITVWIGTKIQNKQSIFSVAGSSIVSSVIFYLITNLPLWYLDIKLYPATVQGTLDSYFMALPFFRNQVIGDLFYNGLLFGLFHVMSKTAYFSMNRKSEFISKK